MARKLHEITSELLEFMCGTMPIGSRSDATALRGLLAMSNTDVQDAVRGGTAALLREHWPRCVALLHLLEPEYTYVSETEPKGSFFYGWDNAEDNWRMVVAVKPHRCELKWVNYPDLVAWYADESKDNGTLPWSEKRVYDNDEEAFEMLTTVWNRTGEQQRGAT